MNPISVCAYRDTLSHWISHHLTKYCAFLQWYDSWELHHESPIWHILSPKLIANPTLVEMHRWIPFPRTSKEIQRELLILLDTINALQSILHSYSHIIISIHRRDKIYQPTPKTTNRWHYIHRNAQFSRIGDTSGESQSDLYSQWMLPIYGKNCAFLKLNCMTCLCMWEWVIFVFSRALFR
jgi:hypothetical protein